MPPAAPSASAEVEAPEPEASAPAGPGRWKRALLRLPGEVYVLTALAALTRFVSLGSPKAIVFDEVYFREYALRYQEGTYYFDLHPPLGKLILGAWAWISGTDASAAGDDPAVMLRVLPALAGTALILAFYCLIRQLCGSRKVATLGAGLLLLDGAILVESRLTTLDSMLLLLGVTGVTLALMARARRAPAPDDGGARAGGGRGAYWLLLAGSALSAGAAASIKLTGLAPLGLVGVIWLISVLEDSRDLPTIWRPTLGQAGLLVLLPVTVYVSSFAVHFALLPDSGPGDAFMSQEFQATLEGNPQYSPDVEMSFVAKFEDLNRAIHQYELALNDSTHPYQSSWTSWPISKRGVFTYVAPADDGKSSYIYVLGNPVVWWGTLLGAAVVVIGWSLRRELFRPWRWPLGLLAFAWAVDYLPFVLIERPMFLYHYFFALMFSLAFVVIGLGVLTGWVQPRTTSARAFSFGSRPSAIGYWSILGIALLAFLYFAPIYYGTPLTPEGLENRMWLSSWR